MFDRSTAQISAWKSILWVRKPGEPREKPSDSERDRQTSGSTKVGGTSDNHSAILTPRGEFQHFYENISRDWRFKNAALRAGILANLYLAVGLSSCSTSRGLWIRNKVLIVNNQRTFFKVKKHCYPVLEAVKKKQRKDATDMGSSNRL